MRVSELTQKVTKYTCTRIRNKSPKKKKQIPKDIKYCNEINGVVNLSGNISVFIDIQTHTHIFFIQNEHCLMRLLKENIMEEPHISPNICMPG